MTSPVPGAFACLLLLFALIASVICVRDVIRERRFDRDISIAREEAKRRGLLK
jgi:hypothetical protein